MDKNTLVFLLIVLAVVTVVGILFWKSYESQKAETNRSDVGVAIANSAGNAASSFFNAFWGGGRS